MPLREGLKACWLPRHISACLGMLQSGPMPSFFSCTAVLLKEGLVVPKRVPWDVRYRSDLKRASLSSHG